mmetsp:Transcript_19785/g.30966  ORF Transcript_19785/g.30966 Transcript_19785/m.30966 type:complete len:210 (-) Transcript_19785:286-915(-)
MLLIVFDARSTAVSNPKVLSVKEMSLSIVLGIPTTEMLCFNSSNAFVIDKAPRRVPSPPRVNKISTSFAAKFLAITIGSWGPLDVPRIVPPWLCMFLTKSGVKFIMFPVGIKPSYPNRKPRKVLTPYLCQRHNTRALMTLLRPGERPPQVTIPTVVVLGSKKIFFLGPAISTIIGFPQSGKSFPEIICPRLVNPSSVCSTHSTMSKYCF